MSVQENHCENGRSSQKSHIENRDMPDVDIKSKGSEPILLNEKYDPDNIWLAESRRPQVAMTGVTLGNVVTTQGIIVLEISGPKEFSDKDRG